MMKILIADDHAIVRTGFHKIIEDYSGNLMVDEAEDGIEVLDKLKESKYDLIILDINMPNKNGLDTLKEIKLINSDQKVIILSMYSDEQYAMRAFKAGASGYLNKTMAPKILNQAIKKVLNGGKYISPDFAEKMLDIFEPSSDKLPHQLLSDREFQIFNLVVQGKSTTEIAGELCLSVKTVSTHRKHILEKMGMKNNTQLVQYAITNSLII
ncbi:MAG: response regulator transcription factor [Bacteroidota bacterium]|nr:response regulator transcription factor [Bacteroidota bacterium]MDP4196424.1 response regulator transcription factor [Bacteroidota bacterium]